MELLPRGAANAGGAWFEDTCAMFAEEEPVKEMPSFLKPETGAATVSKLLDVLAAVGAIGPMFDHPERLKPPAGESEGSEAEDIPDVVSGCSETPVVAEAEAGVGPIAAHPLLLNPPVVWTADAGGVDVDVVASELLANDGPAPAETDAQPTFLNPEGLL